MNRLFQRLGALAIALALSVATLSPAFAQTAVKPDGTPTALQADANGNLKVAGAATGASASQVQGTIASGAADSGNPVKMGCKYNASAVVLTDGWRSDCTLSAYGAVRVQLFADGGINAILPTVLNANGVASGIFGLNTASFGLVSNGTTWDLMPGNVNGVVVQYGLSSTQWNYASGVAGILSNTTTAVTIKTAAGATVRNFVDSCTFNTSAFGAAVPLAIRDGASGTVIWQALVPTAGWVVPVPVVFQTPLRSTANTLLELVTTTANTTGTVYVSCQGHTGT